MQALHMVGWLPPAFLTHVLLLCGGSEFVDRPQILCTRLALKCG